MLQQSKYISNPIIPQENVESRFGKRIVMQNCGSYMDKNKNAGVVCNRITELNMNSRKKVSNVNSDSSQMKDALNHSDYKSVEVLPSKRPLTSYSTYDNQQKFFETKLVPDTQGKMSICVGRKSGSATVNINIDEYDLEKTYHTWKRIIGKSTPHNRSNLENDRFLTVSENAKRSDKLPVVKNRNPPYANPDGPFEKERLNLPKQSRDNLDRTLTPRATCENTCFLKKYNDIPKDSFCFSNFQGNIKPDEVRGVKRTNFPWINSNRIKKILSHNYEDEIEEKHKINDNREKCENNKKNNYNFQNEYVNVENAMDAQREVNYNVSNNSQYGDINYHNITNVPYTDNPSYNNVECNEEQYNNLHNYKNKQNYENHYNDDNQKNYENQQYCNNQQYQHNQANYEHLQNYNGNQNFNSQHNNENISHFGNYNKNVDNSKYDYHNNKTYCCNKGNDCCNNYYEYVNNTSSNNDENLKEQNNLYRAPSLTEIS